jgi:nitric oxide reductase NorD protein
MRDPSADAMPRRASSPDADRPLSADELEERLELSLDAVLSSRRTAAGPARKLRAFDRERQEFVLRWVEIVARSNAEVAFQFADLVAEALPSMDPRAIEAWVVHAMDMYDTQGLHPAVAVLRDVRSFVRRAEEQAHGLVFEEVSGVLSLFLRGLSGRELKLESSEEVYTDTETVFLPPLVCRFAERRENFALYRATAVHLWAQTWFGTFRPGVVEELLAASDPGHAARLFHALETLRLDACLERALPGIHRSLVQLRAALGEPPCPAGLERFAALLREPSANAYRSLEIAADARRLTPPPPLSYQGGLFLDRVASVMGARRDREKAQFRSALARLAAEQDAAPQPLQVDPAGRFTVEQRPDEEMAEGIRFELRLDGQPVAPPVDVQSVMSSILQDFGQIPDDYLVPAGDGGYRPDAVSGEPAADVWKGTYHEEGAFLYNEWDFKRGHYRKNWCVMRELDVHPQPGEFVARTLEKHRGLVKSLRKSFEALRGEDKMLKRQTQGDDIDLDALVQAYADVKSGLELSERLFVKRHKLERDIAVMFMVDMSGSTKGWINDAERESLALLCEALETLGDRYAIYGFSGTTRKRCELYRVKRFDEPYGDLVKRRIAGITPQDYTRMGVAIRHLSRLLNEVEARTRLLVTLSDGKPDDYDGYRGEYGIEDTRQALIEAKQQGIHPFCITIDKEGRDYLPHMYGAVNYVLVDEVGKLPVKVGDIYRRLTG